MRVVLFFLGLLVVFTGFGQQDKNGAVRTYKLKGMVVDDDSRKPIAGIEVYVLGKGRSVFTDEGGRFRIEADFGDELVISGLDILPVYYIVRSNDFIDVRVEDFYKPKSSSETIAKHKELIDSARYYKKNSIEKSLNFIEKSLQLLEVSSYSTQRQASMELLGDIYMYWKQYDLAITNYLSANYEIKSDNVLVKLGNAYLLHKEYAESSKVLNEVVNSRKLNDKQRVEVYINLGKDFEKLNEPKKSLTWYEKALDLAKKNNFDNIVDINEGLANASMKLGRHKEAEGFIKNSLSLNANGNFDSKKLRANNSAADFYNSNQLYDKEIEIRKDNLANAVALEKTGRIASDSIKLPILNYKIATAYIAQDKYKEAIPYLKKSIIEADKAKDIVVEKDATRKLSEALRTVGDFEKALESYQNYVDLVDTLYLRKEQQISQAARFRNDIASKQERITSLEKEWRLQQSKMELAYKNQELTVESNKRQQWTIYSLLLGLVLLGLLTLFIFRNNRQQKLTNNLLALKSLRSQMNPHFIFNALNSVNHYIATNDERNANRFLSQFSSLMRSVLENSEEDVIPFSKELELLQLYTKLEHSRFKDKFDYVFQIDERIAIDSFMIPPMLLQPYVENAIWHGLRYREEKGELAIVVESLDNDKIQVRIKDNGIGRKKSAELKTANQKKQKSKGMDNIKKRIGIINDMYKDKVDVVVRDLDLSETGTEVVVTLKKD